MAMIGSTGRSRKACSRRPLRLLLGLAAMLVAGIAHAETVPPSGYPPAPQPPAGAPNVLIVMTDDVGFGSSSTFGGGVPTPTLDSLAAAGLRYSNFHTTALCSPTRASLLTGRNHHAVGFGVVADLARGEPGYNSIIPKSAGTIAQILSAAGYDTAMLGKHHNVPTWQAGPLGPFDQWANGLGFGYFYGFHGGLTDQFAPALIENRQMIEPPRQADYIFDRDLADRAIDWLRLQRTQGNGRPFLLYLAPGTAHAPLQAPADWLARFRGKFDRGWDVYRAETLARQKRLGIVPANAKLPPLPPGVKPWASLTADEQRLHARHMEAFAAMLAYWDDQFRRVIDELRQSGQLDNTLVIYIQGDNGATGEGGEHGAFDYASRVSGGSPPDVELTHALARIDAIGGPRSYTVAPAGWGVAMNTPFPYHKAVASRLGGTTNGMVVSWPKRIAERGVRGQFTDVTDILPTVLEATGVAAPAAIGGVVQQPFDGTSFVFSFTQPRAPARHRTKYFEIMGHAAIYRDGWLAAERTDDSGEVGYPRPAVDAPWQLYDLTSEFNQITDVAARYPARLAEMRALFQAEGERNHVLPLFTRTVEALLPQSRPEPTAQPGRYTFHPSANRYPEGVFPSINNRDWSLDAELDAPTGGGEGVLVTQGGYFGGWGLVMLKGVPVFIYRRDDSDADLFRLAAPQALAAGRHRIAVSFTVDGAGIGRGGSFAMQIDGRPVASGKIARSVPFKFAPEDASVGHDTGTALTEDYRPPFAYTGALRSLTIELGPARLPKAAAAAVAAGSED